MNFLYCLSYWFKEILSCFKNRNDFLILFDLIFPGVDAFNWKEISTGDELEF